MKFKRKRKYADEKPETKILLHQRGKELIIAVEESSVHTEDLWPDIHNHVKDRRR